MRNFLKNASKWLFPSKARSFSRLKDDLLQDDKPLVYRVSTGVSGHLVLPGHVIRRCIIITKCLCHPDEEFRAFRNDEEGSHGSGTESEQSPETPCFRQRDDGIYISGWRKHLVCVPDLGKYPLHNS